MSNIFVGTRWYKCDLHLHTPASLCFKDRNNITPEQWVQEAIAKDLHCVAVTDHNTAEWIDKIKVAAQDTSLTIFPGVEITCSDSKVHLLILFDVECTTQNVEDFLIKAKIEREDFGIQTAHTNLNLEDIANLANDERALIIPAHIDEFAGLCDVAPKIAKDFYALSIINSVQVVHKDFTLPDGKIYNNQREDFLINLNRYYGLKEIDIDNKKWKFTDERMKNARRVVLDAINTKKTILTFSDNPHEQGDSSHGLWGIGTRHTWIKMETKPSLESLRQALLLPKLRIRNDFDNHPNQYPELWIQKIIIKNTEISDPKNTELCVEFSPQMNTIIGGRGSGKSSILQFIRGAFGRGEELNSLDNIHADFKKFFQKKQKGRNKSGVLRDDSCIEVYVTRKEIEYLISHENQQITVSQLNNSTSIFEVKNNTEILKRLEFDIFSQKQIYEIATSPNSLRTRIDKSDPAISQIENELKLKSNSYVEQSKKVKELKNAIAGKDKILLDIEELEVKINQFRTSDAGELLEKLQSFKEEDRLISDYKSQIETIDFDELIEVLNGIDDFDIIHLRDEYQMELSTIFSDNLVKIKVIV
jgi:PHP family Zn ribbon phosphoesterase